MGLPVRPKWLAFLIAVVLGLSSGALAGCNAGDGSGGDDGPAVEDGNGADGGGEEGEGEGGED